MKKSEKYENKNRKFDGVCYNCVHKEYMSKNCQVWKYNHHKKFEKTGRVIDGDENDMVL